MPRMTKQLAADLLKAVQPVNKKVTYLNHGGCGVLAVQFARLLQDMGFKDVVICSLETEPSYVDKGYHTTNLAMIRNAKKDDYSPTGVETYHHYMVRYGNWFFDSLTATKITGRHVTVNTEEDEEEDLFPIGSYKIEDIEFTNRFQFLWNRTYNRDQNTIVEDYFTKLKKKFVCKSY